MTPSGHLVNMLRVAADDAGSDPGKHRIADEANRLEWAAFMEQAADRIEYLQGLLAMQSAPLASDADELDLLYSDLGIPRVARLALQRMATKREDDAA